MYKLLKLFLYTFYIGSFWYYIVLIHNPTNNVDIVINYLPLGPGVTARRGIEKSNLLKEYSYVYDTAKNFTPPNRVKTDIKYILRWSNAFSHYSTSIFRSGQAGFLAKNCSQYNCFMTNNKALLGDYRNFDAILFDVENFWDIHPEFRSSHQRYIFVASESANNYPICSPYFDGYYNMTWSYKLNSDIRWSYLTVLDIDGNEVGPKVDMNWIDDMKPITDDVRLVFKEKKLAAAWFVSHCDAKSGRENVTKRLEKALKAYNLTIDIYGWCGKLTCPRNNIEECLELLQRRYYFYLSFENSLSEDYVTEKILYPLQYYTVPIVLGGANYSRFLPPGSYLNAGSLNSSTLARKMYEAISNPAVYENYFRWRNHYRYVERPAVADICDLCSSLHDPRRQQHRVYQDFRHWWLPNFESVC